MNNTKETNITAYWLLSTLGEKNSGCEWYANARQECQALGNLHQLTLETVVGVVAALSPRNKWSRNISNAEQVILQGELATVGTFKLNKSKAVRILNGEHPLDVLKGNKVISFYKCLMGDTSEVCVDSHCYGVALGNGERLRPKVISDRDYLEIQSSYVKVAVILGIEPAQLQAVTWLTYRRIHKITG